ncbi:MAG: ABC transporter permease [Tissierella sp.]|uniref:ABC transporter permease n=1 Tax=Tissierella sp. TaxID=41274 RepID=UPI003F95BB8A
MKEIWRNSIYIGKNIFRDKSFTFWELIYPIILATFFYTVFSGITSQEIKTINIGIQKENELASILEPIDILNVVEVPEEDVEDKLENGEIAGFVREDLSLLVDRSELDQTVIKSILDQIHQMTLFDESIENLDFSVDYLKYKNQKSNGIIVIFYSLIAMVSTYGVFPGIEAALISQPNLSNIAARINTTPIKKSNFIISGVVVGLIINILSNILLFIFLKYVFKLDLFINLPYSIIFILLGNLFGISLGIFIGVSNKLSSGVKVMISIVSTLVLSFLSGMMSPDIKILIERHLPILSKINPIAIITNSLYKVNLLNNTKDLSSGILILLSYSVVLILGSCLFIRRRQYDSI